MSEPKPGRSLTDEEIEDRMTYHPPSEAGIHRHAVFASVIGQAMETVDEFAPISREKSLALTKLEEAKMWASAAVARDPLTR